MLLTCVFWRCGPFTSCLLIPVRCEEAEIHMHERAHTSNLALQSKRMERARSQQTERVWDVAPEGEKTPADLHIPFFKLYLKVIEIEHCPFMKPLVKVDVLVMMIFSFDDHFKKCACSSSIPCSGFSQRIPWLSNERGFLAALSCWRPRTQPHGLGRPGDAAHFIFLSTNLKGPVCKI